MRPLIFCLFLLGSNVLAEKNAVGFFNGIEYSRKIGDKLWIGIIANPDLLHQITNDTNTSYIQHKTEHVFELDLYFPIRKTMLQTRFFSLFGLAMPFGGYQFETDEIKRDYLDSNSYNTSFHTYNERKIINLGFDIAFEPVFNPHKKVDIFWRISSGIRYLWNIRGNDVSHSIDSNTRRYSFFLQQSFDVFRNFGMRYYF